MPGDIWKKCKLPTPLGGACCLFLILTGFTEFETWRYGRAAIQRSTEVPLVALTWLAHEAGKCAEVPSSISWCVWAKPSKIRGCVAFLVKTATFGYGCSNRSRGWSYWLCSSWSQCGWRALRLVWWTVWIPKKQQPTAWRFCKPQIPWWLQQQPRPCTSYSDALCEPYNWLVNGQGKAKHDLIWTHGQVGILVWPNDLLWPGKAFASQNV